MATATKKRPAKEPKAAGDLAAAIAAHADVHLNGNNWVGALLEAAIAKGANPPRYVFVQNQGTQHQPLFLYDVELAGVKASGQGPCKQAAKRDAARAWVDQCGG